MHKILLVEDEKNFGLVLRDYLRMNDFEVDLCENGEQGIEKFKSSKYDLCIFDIMMPKKDGFTLSTEIKAMDKNVPLVFLTARGMREDMVKGYKIGADDYIVKPFDSELLLFKIRAILNRKLVSTGNSDQHLYTIGKFSFNARLRSLKCEDGPETKMSPKESELLHLLCQFQNDVLPRELALKQIWKEDTYFTGRSMDVYITKLRKYLMADPDVQISSVHGNGFNLQLRGKK